MSSSQVDSPTESVKDLFLRKKKHYLITALIGFTPIAIERCYDFVDSRFYRSSLPNLEGEWFVVMSPCENVSEFKCSGKFIGSATIKYDKNLREYNITGCSGSRKREKEISYWTNKSWISENNIYFTFENSQTEKGFIYGHITNNLPTSFRLIYVDFPSADSNKDPHGIMEFSKDKQSLGSISEKDICKVNG